MNHTSPRLRITGKFLALSLLLASTNVFAMECVLDTSRLDHIEEEEVLERLQEKSKQERVITKKDEKLSNKEETPSWDKVIKDKFNNLVAKTGVINKWKSCKQKVNDNDYVKITKETAKKIILLAKEYEIPTSVVMSVLGYMTGNLMPVKLVDGIGSSCVTLNVPFVGSYGLCIPVLASFIYNNVKFFNGIVWGAGTYYKLNRDRKWAKAQRRTHVMLQRTHVMLQRSSSEDDLTQQEKQKSE